MKKLLFILIFFSAVQLYSQGADYPHIMNNGVIFLNMGIGFGPKIEAQTLCPPITLSLDIAIPVMNFPMTLGLIAGYFSESSGKGIDLSYFILSGRIAYHLDLFKLPRLDTYILMNIGTIIANVNSKSKGLFGVLAGARYFFMPNFGAYAELGFDTVQNLSFGLTFKI
jgi:hypothetical protein